MSGTTSYHSGKQAEESVARRYSDAGHEIAEHRWRGAGGEIDLVARDNDGLIFIEVKKARDFATAAERVTRRQMERIYITASEYLAKCPLGQLTPARFDVALVDEVGRIDVIENAFGA